MQFAPTIVDVPADAKALAAPRAKPRGQAVADVRGPDGPDGRLVQLCTALA